MHVLWIHGFPLSSEIYSEQLAITGVEHITPDLPGFGGFDAPTRTYSIDDYARDVVRELDRRGIERAVFAGLSMGGYISFAIARLAPERMSALILIDTKETADTPEARKGRYDTIAKVKENGVEVVVDSMLPKMLTPAAPRELVDEVRRIMMSSSVEGVTAALRAMAERRDSSILLPQIDIPTLVVVGEADTITPPADAQRMSKAIPGATLVTIAGAAHLSNVEKPAEFNRAVESFLKRNEEASPRAR